MTDITANTFSYPQNRKHKRFIAAIAAIPLAFTTVLFYGDYQVTRQSFRNAMQSALFKNPDIKAGEWLTFPYNEYTKEAQVVRVDRQTTYRPVEHSNIVGFDQTCLTVEMPYRDTNRYLIQTIDNVCSSHALTQPAGPGG